MAHLQNAQYLHKRLKNKIYCVSSKGDRTLERLQCSLVFCGTLGLSQILVLLLTVDEGLIPNRFTDFSFKWEQLLVTLWNCLDE